MPLGKRAPKDNQVALKDALRSIRQGLRLGGALSLCITFAFLALPFYLINIFNRVLPTRSVDTLISLTLIVVFLFLAYGVLEMVRGQLLSRMGARIDHRLAGVVFDATTDANRTKAVGGQPLNDLATIRGFIASPVATTVFDLPLGLLFIAALFYVHTLLGLIALVSVVVTMLLGWAQDALSKSAYEDGRELTQAENRFADAALRGRDAAVAMGMVGNLEARWSDLRRRAVGENAHANEIFRRMRALTQPFNRLSMVAMIGTAAALAIAGAISPVFMIVSRMLAMRAVQPAMMAVTAWKSFMSARAAYKRLQALLGERGGQAPQTALPPPKGVLGVRDLAVNAANTRQLVIRNAAFTLEPGEALGIIGPNGAGKSTLARALVGVAAPRAGHVRLDGIDMASWAPADRGQHVGFLPQGVEIFDGTLAENISRFQEAEASEAVHDAAARAGVAALAETLPDGYATNVRQHGGLLTGGQRQRVALARALYGDPQLLVLDEPSASLDSEAEDQLLATLADLRAAGKTIVVVSHTPRLLRAMDKVLMLRNGAVANFGPVSKVLPKLVKPVDAAVEDRSGDDGGDSGPPATTDSADSDPDGETPGTSAGRVGS